MTRRGDRPQPKTTSAARPPAAARRLGARSGATGRQRLWRCPRCGHRFTSANLSHSCGHFQLAMHFRNRPAVLRRVFDACVALARGCGPVTIYAQKTRIVFQARVRFAGAVVHKDWLETHLWLRRRVEHPCVHRIEPLGGQGFAIHFRLTKLEDVDASLEGLMREAYDEHVR